jgi:glycosyltransferase involved in cell wall biosynthesis
MGAREVESLEAPTHPPVRPSLRPVRVVYVLANDGYGGTEVHVSQLAVGLDRKQFDPVLLLAENEPMGVFASELREAGMAVSSLPSATRRVDPRGFVELVRVIRAQRADIVHVHMPSPMGGLAPVLAARLTDVPVIVSTEHSHAYHFRSVNGSRGRWLRTIARARIRLSDCVIAVSAAQEASFREVLGVRSSKLTVIPNGIDPDRYSPGHDGSTLRSELGVPSSAPVAGMVTSYAEYERTEDFIRAADHVAAVLPTAYFLIAGDQHPVVVSEHATKMRWDLERLAEAFGLADRVHFLGYRTDMPGVLAGLDVFVLPARYKSSPLVLREAMASELPVVATAAGGVPEVVEDGQTGYLVPPLDPRALGMAMLRVLTNKEEALRMGRRGRRRVEQLFTKDVMIDRTTELYRLLLARRSGHATFESATRP